MSKLDRKFCHNSWFKGSGYTKREALTKLAKMKYDIYLIKILALKQSDNLLDDMIYDNALSDGKYKYRLSNEEYDFYMSIKDS